MFVFSIRQAQLVLWLYIYQVMLSWQLVLGITDEYFQHQQSLVKKLTENSTIIKEILPVVNASSPVELKLSLALYQISNLDEVNQAVRLNVWLRLYWSNPFLQWDPEKYGGVKKIHLDSEHFWTPDISLYNKASLEEDIDILYKRLATKIVLYYNGSCAWKAPVTLLSQCKIHVAKFPFDEQECRVTFGSWTYTTNEINTTRREEKVDLRNFISNGEWKVLSAILKDNSKNYSNNNNSFSDVTFHLRIKRRPLYYGLNLIIPCALIALLSFTSFVLPSDHGERISLVITVLLANSVYMLMVSGSLPQTSDQIPIIGIYFLSIIVEIALCLFATCLTAKICAKNTKMPCWLEALVNERLARFLFVKSEDIIKRRHDNGNLAVVQYDSFTRHVDDNRSVPEITNEPDSNQGEVELLEIGFSSNAQEETGDQFSEVRLLADEARLKMSREGLAMKWQLAAKVLDRLFLCVFFIIYVILTSYLLSSM